MHEFYAFQKGQLGHENNVTLIIYVFMAYN